MSGRDGRPEDEVLGKVYDRRLVRRLLGYLRPYSGLAALSILALLSFSFLDLVRPELVRRAVDGPIADALASPAAIQSALEDLLKLALVFLGVVLVVFFVRGAHMMLVEYMGQRVMVDFLRGRLPGQST